MKTFIRFSTLSLIVIFSISLLIAQSDTKDVLYLKNGSVIKGTILEMVIDKSVKIQTEDGNIFVYSMSDVDRISKESSPWQASSKRNNQGSSSSIGIYGGGAIPVGDFAKDVNFATFNGDVMTMGFAQASWTAGARFVSGGSFGLLIDASYSSNSSNFDKSYADMLRAGLPSWRIENSGGNWSSILILAGLKLGTSNSTGANFFFAPVIGVNIVKSPDATIKMSGSLDIGGYYDTYNIYHPNMVPFTSIMNMPSASQTVLAYGATAEAMFWGGVTIGARYISCSPKYELDETMTVTALGSTATQPASQKPKWEPPVSLIQVYIGYAFSL